MREDYRGSSRTRGKLIGVPPRQSGGEYYCAWNRIVAYYPDFIPDSEVCQRYPHARFPYLRLTLSDESTVDGKASDWQGDRFLAIWFDERRGIHQLWMDNNHAVRIPYRKSRWHGSPSADDIPWRAEQGEL